MRTSLLRLWKSLSHTGEEDEDDTKQRWLSGSPSLSPSSSFFGCRQLVWKGWDHGRGSRLRGNVRSGLRSCHRQSLRHRRRCRRRRVGPGIWRSAETLKGWATGPRSLRGEREACFRRASRSCSRAAYICVISRAKASAIGYCSPAWFLSRTKGNRPSGLRYFGLQLVSKRVIFPSGVIFVLCRRW